MNMKQYMQIFEPICVQFKPYKSQKSCSTTLNSPPRPQCTGAPTQRFPFAYSLTQTHNILTKTHQRLVKEKKFKETNRGFPFWAMATVAECSKELHVLAVDDSYVDRKLIERLLQISSCKVTAVESGTRALQYLGLDGEQSNVGFDALKVNLIITDYTMPGMTGYELLKKIKESSVFREVPVVIMSSEDVLTQIDSCLEEGAEEYIVKPVKLSDVKRLKDHIMRGEPQENGKSGLLKRKLIDDIQASSVPLSFSSSVACDLESSQLPSSLSSPNCPFKRPKLL